MICCALTEQLCMKSYREQDARSYTNFAFPRTSLANRADLSNRQEPNLEDASLVRSVGVARGGGFEGGGLFGFAGGFSGFFLLGGWAVFLDRSFDAATRIEFGED